MESVGGFLSFVGAVLGCRCTCSGDFAWARRPVRVRLVLVELCPAGEERVLVGGAAVLLCVGWKVVLAGDGRDCRLQRPTYQGAQQHGMGMCCSVTHQCLEPVAMGDLVPGLGSHRLASGVYPGVDLAGG